jgi:chaperonin GroEL
MSSIDYEYDRFIKPLRSKKSHTPHVTFQPHVYGNMQQGINMLANVIRPTLGPLPRVVAIDPVLRGNARPEILDDGGVIARRIVALPDQDQDTGAMFLRQVLWQQHEQVGDGTATTAVLFQSIYNLGIKYIAAGGNSMRMRTYLETGLRIILKELQTLAVPLEGQERIAQFAETLCFDAPLAKMLGEIFDIIGENGQLEIREGRGRDIEREYIQGAYFEGGLLSRLMFTNALKSQAELEDTTLLITDLFIQDPGQLIPVLKMVIEANIKSLVVVVNEISEKVLSLLLAASRDPAQFRVIAVKAPADIDGQAVLLQDLAMLTGGRVVLSASGDTLNNVGLENLGRARRVWATTEHFGIVAGKGAPRALRAHIAELRAGVESAKDSQARQKIRERISKLIGGSAVLWVGGISEPEIKIRKGLAERAAETLRSAIAKGVLPGGGASLLACQPAIQSMAEQAGGLDERAAYRILSQALEEPARAILHNAGYHPDEYLGKIKQAGPGHGLDVRSGKIVDMTEVGVIDSAGVLTHAVRAAVSSAALALTVDVLVHKKRPEMALEP